MDMLLWLQMQETLDIPVKGFSTLPAPFPVRAKLGISTLEGDYSVTGDQFRIKANSVQVHLQI